MKIVWVTPFAKRSAIGRVSVAVTNELAARNHEVLIVRSEHERSDLAPAHPSSLPIAWWHDLSPRDLALQNDVIILNFGDNYDFHAGTLAFAESVLCLGIFHDAYLYNFFNRCLVYNGLGEDVHDREVRLTYGESAAPLASKAWHNDAAIEQLADALPMTEWLARRCGAALAHSKYYLNRLESSCPGPIAVSSLCFEGREVGPSRPNGEMITLTTIGIINPNKCADAVIRSIASSRMLRPRCRFRLVGAITNAERTRLQSLCREVGFKNLDILGEVDDATLAAELERADILSCLRKPVLEGASASAIEGMESGRPIITADAGFYADLPDDLVFKVPPSADTGSLTNVLERLVSDEKLRRETGAKAREWALQTFSTNSYVTRLEELVAAFVSARPLLGLGTRIGQQLAALGMEPNDPEIAHLTKKMGGLFGTEIVKT